MTKPPLAAAAGIDLGGTATRVVAWSGGQVIAQDTVATGSVRGGSPADRARRLWDLICHTLPPGYRITRIGIGASGPVDPGTGIIHNPATLPDFTGFDLTGQLTAIAAVPAVIDNDAVTAALGEYHCGAGHGSPRMLLITLGTGIGVALLDRGTPFRQADHRHPEAGHIPVSASQVTCYCGLTGCWEPAASRQALESDLAYLQPRLTPSRLVSAAAQLARDGDPRATAAFTEYGHRVGRGLVLLHSVYGPALTVIGGSVSAHLDLFRTGLEQSLQRCPGFAVTVPVVAAELGSQAGAIGAAIMASGQRHTG